MKKILLSEIVDGMILAQPVSGSGGNVLIGAGTTLHTAMSTRLSGWGVTSVWVESADETAASAAANPGAPSFKEQIEARFAGRLVNSAMKTLQRALLKHRGVSDV